MKTFTTYEFEVTREVFGKKVFTALDTMVKAQFAVRELKAAGFECGPILVRQVSVDTSVEAAVADAKKLLS